MSFKLNAQLEQDSEFICEIDNCQLRLIKDANYPWILLIPLIDEAKDLTDLPIDDYQRVCELSRKLTIAMQTAFSPDKMNVASLGNVVSQLHIHHIARFKTDVAWPNPIWGFAQRKAYSDEGQKQIIEKILYHLQQ